jgi:hypothetical protein
LFIDYDLSLQQHLTMNQSEKEAKRESGRERTRRCRAKKKLAEEAMKQNEERKRAQKIEYNRRYIAKKKAQAAAAAAAPSAQMTSPYQQGYNLDQGLSFMMFLVNNSSKEHFSVDEVRQLISNGFDFMKGQEKQNDDNDKENSG